VISTKGRYALRMLADIAGQDGGPQPLRDVAERQEVSEKYLQRVAKLLVDAGLLVGSSGKGGGYRLARDAARISVLEVLEATEGTVAPVACLAEGAEPCPRAAECPTLPLWKEHYELTRDLFGSVTVATLDGDVNDMMERRVK
jgi:Rrf2 family protein